MSVQNKLDIYKIILKRRGDFTFRSLIETKFLENPDARHTDNGLFNSLYKGILEKLTKEIWKHSDSKLGLTLFSPRGRNSVNKILTSHSREFVIEGFLDGGPYDMVRRLANLDKTKQQNIKKDNIITDKYYIYMYFPLDSNIGIIMLQSKTNANVRTAIKNFFKEICKTDLNKGCRIETYIPEYLKEEFRGGAFVQSLTYTQQFVSTIDANEELVQNEDIYDVSIQIKPQNQNVDLDGLNLLLAKVGDITLTVGNRIKSLSEFDKKKGALRNNELNKTSPFTIENIEMVRPVIVLDGILPKNEDDEFDREVLKQYCSQVKATIHSEVYAISNEN